MKPDPLKPSPALLCKLGSIVVHADEGTSSERHHFDLIALKELLFDQEVVAWLNAMDKLAMIPQKRRSP
jgi:hypothetical protein